MAGKLTQKELRRAERIIRRSPAVAFLWKNLPGWPVEFVTPNVRNLLGYTPRSLLSGKIHYLEVIHPDDRDRVIREVEENSGDPATSSFHHRPYRISTRAGKVIWVDDMTHIQRTRSGRITHYEGIILDVSERIRAEEEKAAALREMGQIFNIATPLCLIGLDRRVLRVNDAFCKTLRLERKQALGRLCHEIWGGALCGEEDCPLNKVLGGLASAICEIEAGEGDDRRIFLNEIKPLRKPSSKIAGLIMTFSDVTESRRAERRIRLYSRDLERMVRERTGELERQALRLEDSRRALTFLLEDVNESRLELEKANRELEAVNRELEAFSYSVSHDLRAPLRAVDGFSQALLEDCSANLDETGREYLTRVRAASQTMARLIDDLLRLSRLTRAPLRLQEVDLTALARKIEGELRREHPGRTVEMNIQDGLRAEADPSLAEVLLRNLLENAWKFTGGRKRARIVFGREANANSTRFFIRDNGTGFDMSYSGKLFGPFQRLHSESEFPGTGIGLATVKRIVVRHGGSVWAQGRPGAGATFSFTLPEAGPPSKENIESP
jgi:PAS domain S-box-containing protein